MTYEDFKNLPRRRAADKSLHNKAFDIVKNPKYDADLLHWFINFIKSSVTCARSETLATQNKFASSGVKSEIMPNQELAEE